MRYKISNLALLKQMLAELDDNPMLPWDAYPCLLWPRKGNTQGYGRLRTKLQKKTLAAHRTAYELAVGPIPEGHDVCHHCDNPPCFRPIHLFTGTRKDNVQDCMAKGRRSDQHGSNHHQAIITEGQVLEMRRLWGMGARNRDLVKQFNVSADRVWHIVHRKQWTHI